MSPELPTGTFDVIYADPPWSYDNGAVPNGGVDNHYQTMDIDDIKSLDVESIAAEDCILYMWGTVTHVPEAVDVIREWGFEHKSQAVWDKVSEGVGYWFRGQHELLYCAVRGDASPPATDARRSSVFREKRTEHSAKPNIVRGYIEQAHPDARKVELFARDNREGWTEFGDEVPNSQQANLLNILPNHQPYHAATDGPATNHRLSDYPNHGTARMKPPG